MNNPFEVLGLRGWAEPDEIRAAYRALVKQCHPDMIQDPQQKEEAQERMVALNLAYEEALRLATPRSQQAPAEPEFTAAETVLMAERALARGNPENALRQLMRASTKDAEWFYIQGQILMALRQYANAHQSFREATRRDPDNLLYRRGAFDAAKAVKKHSQPLQKAADAITGLFHRRK